MIWIWFIGLCPVLQFWGVVISAGSFNVQNPWSRLVALMVFMPVVRFGEAANPGPDDAILCWVQQIDLVCVVKLLLLHHRWLMGICGHLVKRIYVPGN